MPDLEKKIVNGNFYQIIGREPSWVTKYGMSLLAGILVILCAGANLVPYPKKITASATTLFPGVPFRHFMASGPAIRELYVKNFSRVTKGQLLAVAANTARTADLLRVKSILDTPGNNFPDPADLQSLFRGNFRLGEMQEDYDELITVIRSENQHENDIQPAIQKIYAIATRLLLEKLRADIAEWEKKYACKAEADGILSYGEDFIPGQALPPGELLYTIAPGRLSYQALALLSPAEALYLRGGQRTRISLTGYSYLQYGKLEGEVSRLERHDSLFYVFISINSPNAFYRKKLSEKDNPAQAEFIISENSVARSLLEKVMKR